MVGEFVPPWWATLVIVGGDAAYGSKANVSHCPLKEAAFDNKFCSPIEGSQSLLDWASLGR
jgi:hypothetical protein